VSRALGVVRRIEGGICHINGPTVQDEAPVPFGGVKASGYGEFGGYAGRAIRPRLCARRHAHTDVTAAALRIVSETVVNDVVALGGGSTIGLAKAIALRTDLPELKGVSKIIS
jgi:hypothetical protein